MRLFQAFGVFFKILGNAEFAEKVKNLAAEGESSPELPKPELKESKKPVAPKRSDAISLLSALQREARFIDIIQEPLADYSDEQVGAAARDVLSDCKKVVDRFFAIEPVVEEDEGTEFETPVKIDPNEIQVTGNVSGDPPFKGTLVHKGWKASKCELPQWNGNPSAVLIVTPSQVELA